MDGIIESYRINDLSNFDKLNKLKPKLNLERSIKQILMIIKEPHKVYGHGVGSGIDIEKINARLELIESTLLDIKDHLGLLTSMDKLSMLGDDKELKKDNFTHKIQEANWYVYILECGDKSIYTGMGKGEIEEKMQEHLDSLVDLKSGKGSKYVSSRGMFKLVWSKDGFTASEALKEVHRIKRLSSDDKRIIFDSQDSKGNKLNE